MMPATCVPCPLSSYGVTLPFTKSTKAVTRWLPLVLTAVDVPL
jgi:hypothetical protein